MDIMNAGIYGKATAERRLGASITMSAIKWGKPHFRDVVLPDKTLVKQKYRMTELKKGQIFCIWLKRIYRLLKYNFNIVTLFKSIKLGRYRTKLLKNYGIINH